ncbi:hypothetical protein FE840_011885 [Peteryoungia desertarenae]|uniref:Uncharacterized protein n=1 Tax=Peteryoungia desertarenae TaxID=1813451 RepID=A0ABX6QNZ4_9HYPH|nr:hypothetical protein [Peteryoungia desertarenae]QLF70182.1 hypothetical protein FE840_011885 [Peteryoungia desertarenae]
MKFEIKNPRKTRSEFGFVMTFDVQFNAILLRGCALRRVEQYPDQLTFATIREQGERLPAFAISPNVKDEIGRDAVALYNGWTGKNMRFASPREFAEPAPAPDAGLKKMLSAGEADCLRESGL